MDASPSHPTRSRSHSRARRPYNRLSQASDELYIDIPPSTIADMHRTTTETGLEDIHTPKTGKRLSGASSYSVQRRLSQASHYSADSRTSLVRQHRKENTASFDIRPNSSTDTLSNSQNRRRSHIPVPTGKSPEFGRDYRARTPLPSTWSPRLYADYERSPHDKLENSSRASSPALSDVSYKSYRRGRWYPNEATPSPSNTRDRAPLRTISSANRLSPGELSNYSPSTLPRPSPSVSQRSSGGRRDEIRRRADLMRTAVREAQAVDNDIQVPLKQSWNLQAANPIRNDSQPGKGDAGERGPSPTQGAPMPLATSREDAETQKDSSSGPHVNQARYLKNTISMHSTETEPVGGQARGITLEAIGISRTQSPPAKAVTTPPRLTSAGRDSTQEEVRERSVLDGHEEVLDLLDQVVTATSLEAIVDVTAQPPFRSFPKPGSYGSHTASMHTDSAETIIARMAEDCAPGISKEALRSPEALIGDLNEISQSISETLAPSADFGPIMNRPRPNVYSPLLEIDMNSVQRAPKVDSKAAQETGEIKRSESPGTTIEGILNSSAFAPVSGLTGRASSLKHKSKSPPQSLGTAFKTLPSLPAISNMALFANSTSQSPPPALPFTGTSGLPTTPSRPASGSDLQSAKSHEHINSAFNPERRLVPRNSTGSLPRVNSPASRLPIPIRSKPEYTSGLAGGSVTPPHSPKFKLKLKRSERSFFPKQIDKIPDMPAGAAKLGASSKNSVQWVPPIGSEGSDGSRAMVLPVLRVTPPSEADLTMHLTVADENPKQQPAKSRFWRRGSVQVFGDVVRKLNSSKDKELKEKDSTTSMTPLKKTLCVEPEKTSTSAEKPKSWFGRRKDQFRRLRGKATPDAKKL